MKPNPYTMTNTLKTHRGFTYEHTQSYKLGVLEKELFNFNGVAFESEYKLFDFIENFMDKKLKSN